MGARLAVGIDLGTTHTVVASAPLDGDERARVFDVPQLVASGAAERRPLLPSMLYAPAAGEAIDDPFGDGPWALGEIARRRGADVPGRLVASSKSWLVHTGVDRRAPILPWGAGEGTPRLSPVDAAARLLDHVRRCWDAEHAARGYALPLAEQDVVLTVPASFDEVARELSIEAAHRAGLTPKLLEEPQAAFYDWIAQAGAEPFERLVRETPEAVVLVVDVGGGTTDLSLIRVEGRERVTRLAVGPHVLLGGDNMDLALAHVSEPRLGAGDKLDAAGFAQLAGACRVAKERLLVADAPADWPVAIAGRGASLVGAVRSTRLTREEVEKVVLDGFFPVVDRDARLEGRRSALVAFGLPYERDVAVTRHVAAFVRRHLPGDRWPDAVLLNGGVFRAHAVAERLVDVLGTWRGAPVVRLGGTDPDLAVARGAVAYARARRGKGVRIRGGTGHGYFVGVAGDSSALRAVCVVPRGAEEGAVHTALGRRFALALGRPVRFELFASDAVDARPGEVVAIDEERFVRMPPLATTVDASGAPTKSAEVEVGVEGELTPVGTIDLACVAVDGAPAQRYRLAFQLRDAAPRPLSVPPSAPPPRQIDEARVRIERAFGKARGDGREAKDLVRDLERDLGERGRWTMETSRALFDALVPLVGARRRSPDHERAFWLLAGWCIRPGAGDPRDAQRVASLVARFDERLAFPAEARGWQQFWIAWRRSAAGLDDAAQTKIRDFVDVHLAPSGRRSKKSVLALDDALDAASTLERVEPARRVELGGWILERTWTDRDPRLWTAIGRLGARVPSYASVHRVVAPYVAEQWLNHLLREKWDAVPTAAAAAVRLARRTGDRARDVGEAIRRDVERRLVAAGADEAQLRAVREVVPVDEADRAAFFGDALPIGLTLVG